MISVMDVLVIFLSGFISAKVCDYVHELEREEKVNDDSLLEFFYRFIARVLKNRGN